MTTRFYHGGVAGLKRGDALTTGPAHGDDGCPICVARAEGRDCTVGEYREWLLAGLPGVPSELRIRAEQTIAELAAAPQSAAMDPPSEVSALYVTPVRVYALYYAVIRAGDLYRVEPMSQLVRSETDSLESYTVEAGRVVEVLERRPRALTRRNRRELGRLWKKADRRVDRQRRNP